MVFKASALRIFVTQFDAAVAFYRDTLGLALEYLAEGVAHFSVENMELFVEKIEDDELDGEEHVGRFLAISLEAQDIHHAYDSLRRRGVRFTGPPKKTLWGGYMTHFYDLERNCLSLVQYPH